MKKKIYGFSEAAAGEIGTLIGRARGGLIPNGPAKSRHRDNPPRAASSGYTGYFKVANVPTEDGSPATQIKIIDGGNAEDTNCGLTDLGVVPVLTATKTTDRYVWLTVTVNSSLVPTFGVQLLSSAPTTSGMGYYRIGQIAADGSIVQIWQGGEIHFRSEFLI